MARLLLAVILTLPPLVAAAQDGTHVARLEQEVRQLQREVLNLSQLLNELRARVDRPAAPALPSARAASPAFADTAPPAAAGITPARWIDAARWQGLRPGMSELEILEVLGPPTSMRGQDSERVLLYALEIGRAGFLAGSITLRDRVAVTIETPRLK